MTVSEAVDNFVSNVEKLIKKNNISRAEFCRRIGIAPLTLRNLRQKNFMPSMYTTILIANYFNVTLNELFGMCEETNELRAEILAQEKYISELETKLKQIKLVVSK